MTKTERDIKMITEILTFTIEAADRAAVTAAEQMTADPLGTLESMDLRQLAQGRIAKLALRHLQYASEAEGADAAGALQYLRAWARHQLCVCSFGTSTCPISNAVRLAEAQAWQWLVTSIGANR